MNDFDDAMHADEGTPMPGVNPSPTKRGYTVKQRLTHVREGGIMLVEPPVGFTIHDFFDGIYTHQSWEVFPGQKTKGNRDVLNCLAQCAVPASMDGMRVLDIAPWNGFLGFECLRRGASELVSFGPDDPDATGYNKIRQLLQIDNSRYVRGSVYDLDPKVVGTFDVVLFLGLIYHLRHPLLALDRIYDVCRNEVYVDSPVIDSGIPDKTIPDEVKKGLAAEEHSLRAVPLLYFTKGAETGDAYNWFLPNSLALRSMVESSGFDIMSYKDAGARSYLAARKGTRTFIPRLEGFNPQKFNPNN